MKILVKFIATIAFIGYIKFASGTFGSLIGAFIWFLTSTWKLYPLVVIFIIIIGLFTSDYSEKKIFFKNDPREVVIDEVAGMLVSYIGFDFTFNNKSVFILVVGFAIFRFFDILKPQPIKIIQKLPGGVGIMADDIVAGSFTCIILTLFKHIFIL